MTNTKNGSKGTVLLINPSLFLEAGYGHVRVLMRPVPYINLAYLAAGLEKQGVEIHVHDDSVCFLDGNSLTTLLKDISPDLIGISCLTPHANRVAELSRKIKSLVPETPLVLGNIHAGYFDRQLIKSGIADVVVRGEADKTVGELIDAVMNGKDFSDIQGITFQKNDSIKQTPEQPLIRDLDSLPFPAWHLFPYRNYSFTPLSTIRKPLFPILGSRGCPYRCIFCVNREFQGTYRKRNPEKIVEEVKFIVDTFGARQISFFDSNFPLEKKHCLDFCALMIDRGLNRRVVWTAMTKPNLVDEELLRSMKFAGCQRIYYGMESGDDRILLETGKGFNVADSEHAVRITHNAGLESCGFFMLGLPGDREETCRKTVDLALRLPLDFANFNLTVPYPGTQMYEKLERDGKVPSCTWEEYATYNPNAEKLSYVPDGISAQWLIDLQKQSLFRFYFRPRIILRHLLKIRTIPLRDMLFGLWLYLSFHLFPSRK